MIHGACQADLAVLIISAKKGEFEAGFTKSGQTKEHAMLAKSLGVTNMLCVVTKMETVGWD
jgi:peptide chain release factor subunit 3